jgi:hypothetical protein
MDSDAAAVAAVVDVGAAAEVVAAVVEAVDVAAIAAIDAKAIEPTSNSWQGHSRSVLGWPFFSVQA